MFTGMLNRIKRFVMFSHTTLLEMEIPKNSDMPQISIAYIIPLLLIIILPILVNIKISILFELAIFLFISMDGMGVMFWK